VRAKTVNTNRREQNLPKAVSAKME